MLKSVFDTVALIIENPENATEILRDQDNLPLQNRARVLINEATGYNVLDRYLISNSR